MNKKKKLVSKFCLGNCFFSKKGISPVVAMALLLVVSVVSVVTFQSWFSNYESEIFSDVVVKTVSNVDGKIKVDKLIGDSLYILNNGGEEVEVNELTIGGKKCVISENLKLGMNKVNVKDCMEVLNTSTPEVILVTDDVILESQFFVDKISSGNNEPICSEDWIEATGVISDICVYNVNLPRFSWKNDGSNCDSPQCEVVGIGPVLVRDNLIDFSVYAARNKCKELGGYLPNLTQLSEIYIQRNNFSMINVTGTFWSANDRGTDLAFVYGFDVNAPGFFGQTTLNQVLCVKSNS